MILSDRDIRKYIKANKLVIDPISEDTIQQNGVDLTLLSSYKSIRSSWRDPNNDVIFKSIGECQDLSSMFYYNHRRVKKIKIKPLERVLLGTREVIELPSNIVGFCQLRSSLARVGLSIPPTVVDAGFRGNLTIEVIGSSIGISLVPGSRFLHLVFMKTNSPVEKPYNGKYQNQEEITGIL